MIARYRACDAASLGIAAASRASPAWVARQACCGGIPHATWCVGLAATRSRDMATPLSQLPRPLPPRGGREKGVAGVVALLRRPAPSLLPRPGPGGVGKTRLAVQTADEVRNAFADGVAFVPLAALGDPALIAQ